MNLSGAIAGGNAFFEQNERIKLRNQEEQRFDWERQKAESELSLLPDKTTALRSGYKNDTSRNESELALRPGEQSNKLEEQRQRAYSLERARSRQGLLEDTNDTNAESGKVKADTALALSKDELAQLPDTIARAHRDKAISDADAADKLHTGVATYFRLRDNAGAAKLINETILTGQNGGKPPENPIVDWKPEQDPKTGKTMLIGVDAQGNARYSLDREEMQQKAYPVTTHIVPAGGSVVSTDKSGRTAVQATVPAKPTSGGKEGQVISLIKLYQQQGKTLEEATRMATKLKQMDPSNAVFKRYDELAKVRPPRTPEQRQALMDSAKAEVALIFGNDAVYNNQTTQGPVVGGYGAAQPGSNTPSSGTRFDGILGIKPPKPPQ